MNTAIVFGTGLLSEIIRFQLVNWKIIEYWDNNASIDGKEIDGVPVVLPHKDTSDVPIIIASSSYNEIYTQLVHSLGIRPDRIKNYMFPEKIDLLDYYETREDINQEEQEVIEYIKDHDLDIFNYPFRDRYLSSKVEVLRDSLDHSYVMHHGYKMYFCDEMKEDEISEYYKLCLQDQDSYSPHCYENYIPDQEYDLVIDCGCAEGDFLLDIAEKAKRIVAVEPNSQWIQALERTINPLKNKVLLVNKFIADSSDDNCITIDDIITEYDIKCDDKVLIKMDIEGAEEKALRGGKCLESMNQVVVVSCSYHHMSAEKNIRELLEGYGFSVSTSRGYMFFSARNEYFTVDGITGQYQAPRLRRALVVGTKMK